MTRQEDPKKFVLRQWSELSSVNEKINVFFKIIIIARYLILVMISAWWSIVVNGCLSVSQPCDSLATCPMSAEMGFNPPQPSRR